MSMDGDQVEKLAAIFKVGTPYYALYFSPCRDKDPKRVHAIVIKVTVGNQLEKNMAQDILGGLRDTRNEKFALHPWF